MWIFGYGSLLSAEGLKNRGIAYEYDESDLIEVRLHGYRRMWNAVWNGNRFLGCVKDDASTINGVIFPLFPDDFEAFKRSEGFDAEPPTYFLADVKERISCPESFKINPDDRILTCVTVRRNLEGSIPLSYIKELKESLRIRGPKFTEEFIETTYPKNIFQETLLWKNT